MAKKIQKRQKVAVAVAVAVVAAAVAAAVAVAVAAVSSCCNQCFLYSVCVEVEVYGGRHTVHYNGIERLSNIYLRSKCCVLGYPLSRNR